MEEKPKSVDDVVLFCGNLAELREFTGEDWKISSLEPFFIDYQYPECDYSIRSDIQDSGYDGLIHVEVFD